MNYYVHIVLFLVLTLFSCHSGFSVQGDNAIMLRNKKLTKSFFIVNIDEDCSVYYDTAFFAGAIDMRDLGSVYRFIPGPLAIESKLKAVLNSDFSEIRKSRKLMKIASSERYAITWNTDSGATIDGFWIDESMDTILTKKPYSSNAPFIPDGLYAIADDFGGSAIICVSGPYITVREFSL